MRPVLLLLTVLLIVPLAAVLPSCGAASQPNVPELYIISPHGTDIRREFETGFSKWHQKKYGTPVKIEWPDVGGTGTLMKLLAADYAARGTCGFDLIFGGGSGVFNDLAARHFLAPADLPPNVLASLPSQIHGVPLRGPDNLWYGATLSYFGIVVNKDRLRELHLDPPRTWQDLTAPGFVGELSVADPSKSQSVATCYEMILQQYGWEKGWSILARIFAAAPAVKEGGAWPSEETGMGNAAAGIVINFYGRMAISKYGQTIAAFIVPEGGSSLDPDPIAMLKGAPNPVLAAHMIEFVLSPDGQRLWTHRPGTPGGPVHAALGRMSIRPELYQHESQYMTDPASPFSASPPLKIDAQVRQERAPLLGEAIKAAFIDHHDDLVAARVAVKARGDDPKLLAMFDLLPFAAADLETIRKQWLQSDPAAAEAYQSRLKAAWREMFRKRWLDIQRAAAQ